ncbi:hypothetical protein PsYK624_171770 [Phanerochaete sordida]|uniref:Uncharacterized protein n=1 Tax=Phanerochaete sordida TaxID=48140 RepID=A0A9P3GUY9_9APHY|nr:hypothetical protein PsYK624_171770 [Phanerochaete sordida]
MEIKTEITIDNYRNRVMAPKWFTEYCLTLQEAIWKHSLLETIKDFHMPTHLKCWDKCKGRIQGDLRRLLSRMAATAKEELEEVEVDTSFPKDIEALILERQRKRAAAATPAISVQAQSVSRSRRVG